MPASKPVTTPPPVTDMIVVLPDVHTPPGVASLNVIFEFTQTADGPPIAAGNGLTVTSFVAKQPVDVSI